MGVVMVHDSSHVCVDWEDISFDFREHSCNCAMMGNCRSAFKSVQGMPQDLRWPHSMVKIGAIMHAQSCWRNTCSCSRSRSGSSASA